MSCPHLHARATFVRPFAPFLKRPEIRFVTCKDCGATLEGWGSPVERYALADLRDYVGPDWPHGGFRAPANANAVVEPGPAPASSPRRARSQAAEENARALYEQASEIDDLRPNEAKALYEQALALNPSHARAMVNLGNLHYRDGDESMAVTLYRSALDIDPDLTEAHYNLGHICLEQEAVSLAIEYLRRAIEITPTMADAHYNLAQAYARRSAFDFARLHFARFLAIEPSGAWAESARRYLADENALRCLAG